MNIFSLVINKTNSCNFVPIYNNNDDDDGKQEKKRNDKYALYHHKWKFFNTYIQTAIIDSCNNGSKYVN